MARRVLLLCKRCGTSCAKVANLAGHVAVCGPKRGPSPRGGDKRCSHCTKTFRSQRGLSQHRLRAHLEEYMEGIRQEPGHLGRRTQGGRGLGRRR
ncbi:hypothetical protein NQD34_002902 [Periophthalmus magnuspinnatus]|nr:hypothetical protein NQD34_002902 [Periophthalmus magnuspinnatus]